MSVLTIAQNVAGSAGFQQPTYLVGNPDDLAIQLLNLINEETIYLSNEFFWQKLVQRYSFTWVPNQEAYDVPADYDFLLPQTMWNHSSRRPIICPISAEDYEIQKNYLVTSGIDKMAYMRNNQIFFTPIPSGTSVTVPSDGLSTTIATNVVVVTLSSATNLVTGQIVSISGATGFNGLTGGQLNISAAVTVINNTQFSYVVTGAPAGGSGPGGGASIVLLYGDSIVYEYVSINTYKDLSGNGLSAINADTNTTVVKEILVQLGVKLRFLNAKGLISSPDLSRSFEYMDYMRQIKRQMMNDGIGQKIIRMSSNGNAYWRAAYTQDSNYPGM